MAKSKKAVAKKAAPKKATAKKAVVKKAAPKKAVAKKIAPKKVAPKTATVKKAVAKKSSKKTSAPWAYINTDPTPGVVTYAESRNNSWAAIGVWISITTNPDFLPSLFGTQAPPADTAKLAKAFGITETCVKFIRNIAVDGKNEDLYNAFKAVSNAFVQIGFGVNADVVKPLDPPPYPPKQCLGIDDIVTRMEWIKKKIKPIRVIVPAGG